MRMSDIVSYLDLSIYPQVALVLFLGVFAGVVLRIIGKTRARELEACGLLPLEDGADAAPANHTRAN